jgi:hypothetical protein
MLASTRWYPADADHSDIDECRIAQAIRPRNPHPGNRRGEVDTLADLLLV